MQPEERDAACLWDMLDAAQTIETFISDLIAQLEPLIPPLPSAPEE